MTGVLLAVRQLRMQALIWGGLFGCYSAFLVSSMDRLSQGPASDRLALLEGLKQIANTSGWFLPEAHNIDTTPGYFEWQGLGTFVVAFAIWGCVVGTGLTRGDEERAIIDVLITGGVRRWRIIVERTLAFAVSLGGVLGFGGIVVYGIGRLGSDPVGARGLAGQLLAFSGVVMCSFALGLVTSQLFPTRRNALAMAALAIVALFVVNGFGRIKSSLHLMRSFSPFYYYEQSDAMSPGGHLGVTGIVVLFAITVALVTLAIVLFAHRDLGTSLIHTRGVSRRENSPSTNPLLGSSVLASLWDQRIGLLIWVAAVGLYAEALVSLANGFVNAAKSQTAGSLGAQQLHAFGLDRGHSPALGFVSVAWFSVACLLMAIYAITLVARWSADDVEGRLEVALSAGWPRWRVVLDRSFVLVLGATVVLAASAGGVIVGGSTISVTFDAGRLALATVLVIPVTLAFGLAGSALAAFRPRMAMGVMAAVATLSYFIPLTAAPLFAPKAPPKWYLNLSIFQLYGTPLTDGVYWTGLYVILAVVFVGFVLSTTLMLRREVGR